MKSKTGNISLLMVALIIVLIFFFSIFTFRLNTNEYAVIVTLGKVTESYNGKDDAGLHFCFPYPIQEVVKLKNSSYCFTGNLAQYEETLTKDGKNVIIGLYLVYNISDPVKFIKKVNNGVLGAEELLNSTMVNVKNSIIGEYKFNQLINTDRDKIKLAEITEKMKDRINKRATDSYGMTVSSVGINLLNIPANVTAKVFERMRKEREKFATTFRAEGKKNAEIIKSEADAEAIKIVAEAEAKAKEIMAKGDAETAKYYLIFSQNPELAEFLRKLSSLETAMDKDTTLILDTNSVPFDLLKNEKIKRENERK
jgi:membrane protease subunit HflC